MAPFRRWLTGLALLTLAAAALLGAAPYQPARAAGTAAAGLDILAGRVPVIDGDCSDFSDVTPLTFADASGTGKIFLKFADPQLYVCLNGSLGSFKGRFARLYLDPQGNGAGYEFAAKDDYALQVGIPDGINATFNGTDVANGYTANAALAGSWNGKTKADANGESVEWSVDYKNFGIQPCQLFGLAGYHHWLTGIGDDYGWPSKQWFDQPRTWQLARINTGQCGGQNGRIAYIYRGATGPAAAFYNLLNGAGYTVDLITLSSVMTTVFSTPASGPNYELILIADDSGSLERWGSTAPPPDISADQVNRIRAANIPIIGLGEGGYAFFGKLGLYIGWPNGWHGPNDRVKRAAGAPAAYYTGIAGDPVQLYGAAVNEVGVYLNAPPSDVQAIGLEVASNDHAGIIQQGCRLLWGFSGDPSAMSANGTAMFLNAVNYMHVFQCAPEPPPPVECVVTKSADPATGSPVTPGQIIKYTITYTNCRPEPVKLADSIPADTIYVPGSASDGIAPGADGSLIWTIPATPNPGSSGTKTFRVRVSDTQCHNQRTVNNRAGLLIPGQLPVTSNVVTHPVTCPPITLPNNDPPYAEQEVQIHPYPLITGTPSAISVRLSNSSNTAQAVRVSFQTSPQRFGIGINFATFDSRLVTLPAHGNAIVTSSYTPVSSGHYCIQIKIEDASPTPQYAPIYTWRNLDVTEDLQAGVPDTLPFKVANPTGATANITLVVDNTCPGWSASVAPTTLTNVGPNGGDVRDATLTVTPPSPATLGSGCHIDVQGWIGDTLIGGIRKLDVPPVHLPTDIAPPWLEPEISVSPNPPVAGQPAQICVALQNPLNVAKNVTLEYAVADFGAGIAFTTLATRNLALPANSNANYCTPWTPSSSGTLHRCIQITLKQPGYRDMHSQLNIDLRRISIVTLLQLDIPLGVRNPDGVPHRLELRPTLYGLDPLWRIRWLGDPPPDQIGANQTLNLRLGFERIAQAGLQPAQFGIGTRTFGDEQRVDVAVVLDGVETGGFTIKLQDGSMFLPITRR